MTEIADFQSATRVVTTAAPAGTDSATQQPSSQAQPVIVQTSSTSQAQVNMQCLELLTSDSLISVLFCDAD